MGDQSVNGAGKISFLELQGKPPKVDPPRIPAPEKPKSETAAFLRKTKDINEILPKTENPTCTSSIFQSKSFNVVTPLLVSDPLDWDPAAPLASGKLERYTAHITDPQTGNKEPVYIWRQLDPQDYSLTNAVKEKGYRPVTFIYPPEMADGKPVEGPFFVNRCHDGLFEPQTSTVADTTLDFLP